MPGAVSPARPGLPPRLQGFSLIESMIALAIVALGLMGSGRMFALALQQLEANAQRRAVVLFVEELTDELLAARTSFTRTGEFECAPGAAACFTEPTLDGLLARWRTRVRERVSDARVQLSAQVCAESTVVLITVEWPDRLNSSASERFELVVKR